MVSTPVSLAPARLTQRDRRGVMRTKMIPLLKNYREDRRLVFELLKVLLLMTDAPHPTASDREKKEQHEVLGVCVPELPFQF